MSAPFPPLPPQAMCALFAGNSRQGPEIRCLSEGYETNCAQYTAHQMQAYVEADRASRAPTSEEFEVWAIKEGHRVDKDGAGDYIKLPAHWSWIAWQAAQAAMQAEWDAESDAASEREIANTPWAKP